MNLREWRLQELEQEISVYRQSAYAGECEGKSLPELEAYWTELHDHCERILKAAHGFSSSALTDRLLAYLEAGLSLDEIPKLRLPTAEPIVDLRRLKALLPASGEALAVRACVALSVAKVVIVEAIKVHTEVSGARNAEGDPYWPAVMLALCNGYPEVSVSQPWKALEPGEGTDPAATVPGGMWQAILRLAEDEGTSLCERVQALEPPLTWAEVCTTFYVL
jgi:hypothetical protein